MPFHDYEVAEYVERERQRCERAVAAWIEQLRLTSPLAAESLARDICGFAPKKELAQVPTPQIQIGLMQEALQMLSEAAQYIKDLKHSRAVTVLEAPDGSFEQALNHLPVGLASAFRHVRTQLLRVEGCLE